MKRRGTPRERKQAPALEIRHLRAFVALVDRGSITGAAQFLRLAQSTVSESLAALERALGTPVTLRRRGSHEVSLTASGLALLPHARGVLEQIDAAHMAVASVTNGAHATVEIVAAESVSTYLLPKALAMLRAQWPNTRFEVSVATCPGVRAGIHDGEFDVGLLLESDEPMDSSSTSAPTTAGLPASDRVVVAADLPLVIFAGSLHPLARQSERTLVRRDELAAYPLFMSDAAGDFHVLVRHFFESDGLPGPHLEVAGSVEGVKRGVATDSQALGILPAYAVVEDLQDKRLAALRVRPKPPCMRLEALLSMVRPRHPAAAELLDGISQAIEAGGPRLLNHAERS